MWAEKEFSNLYLVNLPKDRFQSNHSFLNLIMIVSRRLILLCVVKLNMYNTRQKTYA